jgi:hypothetical protein
MSDHSSAGLFEVAFYCILVAVVLLWALRHLDIRI